MKWFVFLTSTIFVVAFFSLVTFGVSKISSTGIETDSTVKLPQATLSAVSLSSEESAILDEINRLRTNSGLLPLSSSSKTQDIALYRTTDMQSKQYYSHTSLEGVGFKDLIPNGSGFACENLLLTQSDNAENIVEEWIKSSSHRDCILSDKITIAGISAGKFDPSTNSTLDSRLVTFIAAQR